MELIINKSTRILKEMNAERRYLFVERVLSNYNYQANNFDDFMLATKKELEENHNLKMSLEAVKQNFFFNFAKNINLAIWEFLSAEDKRDIKSIDNIEVEQIEIQKFIENNCKKIRNYADYIKSLAGQNSSEDLEVIYCYLAKSYGWTLDYIKEMDELELLKAIEQSIVIDKKEQINNINSQALAGAMASGSRKAKTQVDGLSQKLETEINIKKLKKTNPKLELKNALSDEQLKKIMEDDNGRRS